MIHSLPCRAGQTDVASIGHPDGVAAAMAQELWTRLARGGILARETATGNTLGRLPGLAGSWQQGGIWMTADQKLSTHEPGRQHPVRSVRSGSPPSPRSVALLAWAALCVAVLALILSIIALARGRSYSPREWIEASERALEEKLRRLGPATDFKSLLQPPSPQEARGPDVTTEGLVDAVKRACAPGLTSFQRQQPVDELKGRKARLECVVEDVTPWPEILGPNTAQVRASLAGSPLTVMRDPETGKPMQARELPIKVEAYVPKEKASNLRRAQRVYLAGKIERVTCGYPITWGDWTITLKPAEPSESSSAK